MSGPWRLVVDTPGDGAWNMAVDEALLEAYTREDFPDTPTLRLYGWSPATLSLGSRQPARGAHDPVYLRDKGLGLVRRPTGGRAVLHEHERTYAVVGRLRGEAFPGGVVETYRRIAEALVDGLSRLGISAELSGGAAGRGRAFSTPVCFDRPSVHEIAVGGRKIVGSAQLRRRGAFLQHGSILVRANLARHVKATGALSFGGSLTDLETVLGSTVDPDRLDRALVAGFERAFATPTQVGSLTPDEIVRATRLRTWKYDSASWTYDGVIGSRERRWGPRV